MSAKRLLLALAILMPLPAQATDYVFIFKSLTHGYWQAMKQGVDAAVKEHKMDARILVPTSDQAKEEHLNLCQTAISLNPKIIVMGPATTAIGVECFRMAHMKGIKVADLDAAVSVADAQKAGVPLAYTIGADNVKIGHTAADYVAKHATRPDARILLLAGVVGSPPSDERIRGFRERLHAAMPLARIIHEAPAEWDRLRGMTVTADTLTSTPNLDVVFAANDTMAVGAVEAAKQADKAPMIIGVDGTPDARRAITAGQMTATITQLPYLIGKRAAEKAHEVVTKGRTQQVERAQLLVLTRDVIEAGKEPLLEYVR